MAKRKRSCKKCKFFFRGEKKLTLKLDGYCDYHKMPVDADDYCSAYQRKVTTKVTTDPANE